MQLYLPSVMKRPNLDGFGDLPLAVGFNDFSTGRKIKSVREQHSQATTQGRRTGKGRDRTGDQMALDLQFYHCTSPPVHVFSPDPSS